MPRKARRRRIRLRPAPWLALALLLNIGLGLAFSPLTSLTKVRVVGAAPSDQGRVREILTNLKGVPASRVDPFRVESAAQLRPDVERASFRRNLFGRGLLTFEMRVPVARLTDAEAIGIDRDGAMFRTDRPMDALPFIRLEPGAIAPWGALQVPVQVSAAARLAPTVQALDPERPPEIQIDSQGALCLNMGSGRVRLGTHEQLDAKMVRLREILNADPGLFRQVAEVNLTSPERPTIVVGKKENR